MGDSIAFETRDPLASLVTADDAAELAFIGFGAAGICDVIGDRNDFLDATNKLAYQVSQLRPQIIVLSFWKT